MASELTVNATAQYSDSEGTTATLQTTDLLVTVATKRVTRLKQAVGITEEAVQLGDVTAPGFVMLKNLDATNFISVKSGTGGVIVGKMLPGESYGPVRLGSGMQAPFVIADTGACQMDVLIVST